MVVVELYCNMYTDMTAASVVKKNGYFTVKIVLSSLWKGVNSNRKEFAPIGSKFFSFRVDLFSERVFAKPRIPYCIKAKGKSQVISLVRNV